MTLNSGGSIYFPHSNNKNGDFDLQVSQCRLSRCVYALTIFLEEVTDGPDCDKHTNLLFQRTPVSSRQLCRWELGDLNVPEDKYRVVSGYKNPFSRYD